MTLSILGGTFDPVHHGHLLLAREVMAEFGYDRVLFVPACVPAHKKAPDVRGDGALPEDRARMVRLAIDGTPEFQLDECELRRGGISYTIDTIRYVEGEYALDAKPGIVIGDDLLAGFPGWREPEEIARRADLIIAHRVHVEELPFAYPHRYCHNMMLPHTSSLIRERCRGGLPVRFLVPDSVDRYIAARGLYR